MKIRFYDIKFMVLGSTALLFIVLLNLYFQYLYFDLNSTRHLSLYTSAAHFLMPIASMMLMVFICILHLNFNKMNAFGQLPNHNPVKFYAMLMLSLIVACFFALAFSACNDPEETKVDPDKPSFGNSIRLMKTRNNSGNAAPLDSFIYIPAAYGSKMKVRLEARNPGRRNSYLSKLRRLGEVDPNARFWHDSIDLTISDTMSILFTDTFFVCRRVRI